MTPTPERVRAMRLRCWLMHRGVEWAGHTITVGAHAASLRFEEGALEEEGVDLHARRALALRLPGQERMLRLEAELTWVRRDAREAATLVGVAWSDLTPASRDALEELVASYRHTVVVLCPDGAEAERLTALLSPAHGVVVARTVDEARAAFGDGAVAVLLLARSAQDPLRALRELDVAVRAAMATPVVLGAHAEGSVPEWLDVGRIFGLLGRPLQDDVVEKLVHRATEAHELTVENARLRVELERSVQALAKENRYLRQRLTGAAGFERIIGSSPALLRSLDEVERVRRTDATVFIHGDTGTGKELVARALHAGGPRARGPFVAQNCAGIPETLLASALFGHVKGAFTGADRSRPGVFQEADGGTLFLDEVAELSPAVQAGLLRALQEREVTPVGSSRAVKVDVRIVSASHKDLREEARAGRFREDLLYRLLVVTLRLPPLRERAGDIALLARHFLDLFCTRHGKHLRGLTAETVRLLEAHGWPGNVRELENEIERLVVMAEDGALATPDLLAEHLRGPSAAPPAARAAGDDGVFLSFDTPYDEALERLERALVKRALDLEEKNFTQAARRLGIKRTRLFKIRARLGIDG